MPHKKNSLLKTQNPLEKNFDVIICTRNPQIQSLERSLKSILHQSCPPANIFLVDNNSDIPVSSKLLPYHGSITFLHESNAGLVHARVKGIEASKSDFLLFVDDDNDLTANYLSEAKRFMISNPDIGAIGGRCLLPAEYKVAKSLFPLIEGLGIRDYGTKVLRGNSAEWGKWEPIGAGMVITKEVAKLFVEKYYAFNEVRALGRSDRGILGGEDAFIVRCAYELDLKSAYVPSLSLIHWVGQKRLSPGYLFRLSYGYGRSRIILNRSLEKCGMKSPSKQISTISLWNTFLFRLKQHPIRGLFYFAGDLGELSEKSRQFRPQE